MNNLQLLQELKDTISVHLESCNQKDTPFICANISTPDGKHKIIDQIADIVITRKTTIGDAVLVLESINNPNILD